MSVRRARGYGGTVRLRGALLAFAFRSHPLHCLRARCWKLRPLCRFEQGLTLQLMHTNERCQLRSMLRIPPKKGRRHAGWMEAPCRAYHYSMFCRTNTFLCGDVCRDVEISRDFTPEWTFQASLKATWPCRSNHCPPICTSIGRNVDYKGNGDLTSSLRSGSYVCTCILPYSVLPMNAFPQVCKLHIPVLRATKLHCLCSTFPLPIHHKLNNNYWGGVAESHGEYA